MRIYISGKISFLPFDEVQNKFKTAQEKLEQLGFEVVNPLKNGLTVNDSWEEHIKLDILTLSSCDAIYMLRDWSLSRGALIEHDFADKNKLDMWFEANGSPAERIAMKVANAVFNATGQRLSGMSKRGKQIETVYARMLFSYFCRKENMLFREISSFVKRNTSTVIHSLKLVDNEVSYNPKFRKMFNEIETALNEIENNYNLKLK